MSPGSTAGAFFMMGVLCLYRYCVSRREFSYERVAHSLDEEEQAFKRKLEMEVRMDKYRGIHMTWRRCGNWSI